MAADLFTTLNEVSILLAGRRPEWLTQQDLLIPNGLPIASSGVPLKDSPRTQVLVDAREALAFRTVYIAVRVLDLTGTYRATVNGSNVDFDAAAAAAATRADVIQGWVDAINADVVVNLLVTAEALTLQGGSGVDTIRIKGDKLAGADYTIGVSSTVGTPEMDVVADVSKVDFRIFVTLKPPTPPGVAVPSTVASAPTSPGPAGGFPSDLVKFGAGDWRNPNGAVYATNGFLGFAEIFDTAGQDRLYVEATALTTPADVVAGPHTLTYLPRITIGPAILES